MIMSKYNELEYIMTIIIMKWYWRKFGYIKVSDVFGVLAKINYDSSTAKWLI
jgi:hypothetical protein